MLDSFSKKKLLIAYLTCIVFVFFFYSISTSIPSLITARLLNGVCIGCVAPLSLAIASDSLPVSKLGKGIGIITLCQAFGQTVGPNLGLSLGNSIGYHYTFLIGTATMIAGVVLSFFLKESKVRYEPYKIRFGKIIEKKSFHSAIILFFLMISYCCINSYLPIFGDALGIDNISLYFTVYAIIATQPLSGILLDKYGYDKVLVPGIIFFAISFFIIGISRSINGFLIAAVVSSFGYGICYPTVQSLSMSCAPSSHRGAASSTFYLGADFGMLVGSSIAGLFIDKVIHYSGSTVIGYSSMFYLMTIPIILCLFYYMIVRKKIILVINSNFTENE